MIQQLKEIVNPKVVLTVNKTKKTEESILLLKENSLDSEIKKLYIKNIPDEAFAFTIDYQPVEESDEMFQQLSCYFDSSNKHGINQHCDLILVSKKIEASIWDVLIFDLKSKRPDKGHTQSQLLNSEIFFDYICWLLKYHYKINPELQIYRAIVTTAPTKKNSTYSLNRNTMGDLFYHAISVTPKQGEASVNLDKLLQEVIDKEKILLGMD